VPDFSFTPDEVEEKAGKKPWTRQRRFSDEIDPDDMADTAAVYARAGGEAKEAGALGRNASEAGADSGALNGASLVDASDRDRRTALGLQDNGLNVDEVVNRLVRAMNLAFDAEEEVRMLIVGDGGLEEARSRHIAAAINEWNGWQAALEAAVAAAPATRLDDLAIQRPVSGQSLDVTYRGLTRTILGDVAGGRVTYRLPDSLADDIRQRHLADAADSAQQYDEDITAAITAYRRRLTELGHDLSEYGYDFTDGPVGLWTSDEMADFAADRLAEELRKNHPDADAVLAYTEVLGSITGGLGDPPRDLTADELAYLRTFYNQLSADELAKLGALTEAGGYQPGQEGWLATAAEHVANGVNVLLNPALGGLDPTGDNVPRAIREFVYDRDSMVYDAHMPVGWEDDLERFNDFGALMASATLGPGDAFGEDLADLALDLQDAANRQYFLGWNESNDTVNTVTSDLLHAVSLNTGVSAGLLNDEAFRDRLLTQVYQTSDGVGDLLRAGTTIPADMDPNSDEAERYFRAAFNVLADAPDHRDSILGRDVTPLASHAALQDALGDVAVTHMDMISKDGETSRFDVPGGAGGFTDKDLYGNDYRFSFVLGREDRQDLFDLLVQGEESSKENFQQGVGRWAEATAYNAFQRDADGAGDQASAFHGIGRVIGTMRNAELEAETQLPAYSSDANSSVVAAVTAVGAAVRDTISPVPVKWALRAATLGVGEGTRHYLLPDSPDVDPNPRLDALEFGDDLARTLVADAAVRAGYRGADESDWDDPTSSDLNDLKRKFEDLEGDKYPEYAGAMADAYQRALG
jgi:hypothetical protein